MGSLSLAPAINGAPGTADGRAREGTSAGNNMGREPGTGDGKPGTCDCAVQCTCEHARLIYPRLYLYQYNNYT